MSPPSPARARWPLLLVNALVPLLVIALCGLGIALVLDAQQRRETTRLLGIADLQTRHVAQWLRERAADAEMVRISPFLLEEFRRSQTGDDPDSAHRMQARLAPLLTAEGFAAIDLYAPDGRQLWSTTAPPQATAPELAQAIEQARQSRRVEWAGPYLHPAGQVWLDLVVPLGAGPGPAPVIVLRADTADWLCPTLRTWPTLSRSGESFLIRRDGDQVSYLCPLRHRPDAALRLRLPVASEGLLAARMLRGELAPGEVGTALDY